MTDLINCCFLALIAFCGNIVQLVFFFNYSLKLKEQSIELTKRTEELEKKNGSEQRQIEQLNQKLAELAKKINHDQRPITTRTKRKN